MPAQNLHPLNRYNLDLFNQQFENSEKDHYFTKIFRQNQDNNLISSQSLFCYTNEYDEFEHVIPRTPVKDRMGNFSVNDHQEVMST